MSAVKVKICGIRDAAMANVAAEAGADFIGLVFVPNTPRFITVEQAAQIVGELGNSGPPKVGLFVDAPADDIRKIADEVGLDYIQLAGNERVEMVRKLNRPVIKSIRASDLFWEQKEVVIAEATAWHEAGAIPLLDGAGNGQGKVADWELASEIAKLFPIMLAGGLTPANVAYGILEVQPWGVDVSSGVERERGVKDATLIRSFVAAAKRLADS